MFVHARVLRQNFDDIIIQITHVTNYPPKDFSQRCTHHSIIKPCNGVATYDPLYVI